MSTPRNPSLFQLNTRVWLNAVSRRLNRATTLADISDRHLDELARTGFDWIYLLGVWQTGEAGRAVSRAEPGWRREFRETLHDLQEEDIAGSCFAVTGYSVHETLGGDQALAALRKRFNERGLRMMLDFVPNHMALDHPWTKTHPEYFIAGTEADLSREPQNYVRLPDGRIFAYGRDPYFSGWPDTLQLDYSNPGLHAAMGKELLSISEKCDGLRCDMAMLNLPDIFQRTWNRRPEPFWAKAIAGVKGKHPDFTFMAEVYWDLEWTMQQEGFDYAYDKRLYDRLHGGDPGPVRGHFHADMAYQNKLARFLENHDEPRAAATFPPGKHEAAAIATFTSPGLRFFHQGQFEGKHVRISPHLVRGPAEPANDAVKKFYANLLEVLRLKAPREGDWKLLEPRSAWDGNGTHEAFLLWTWEATPERLLVAVNYSDAPAQCYVNLPFAKGAGRLRLRDLMGDAVYYRDRKELAERGLYLDLPAWGYHLFEVTEQE